MEKKKLLDPTKGRFWICIGARPLEGNKMMTDVLSVYIP
jgi:hypothetical protein